MNTTETDVQSIENFVKYSKKYSLSSIDYAICIITLFSSVSISLYFGCLRKRQATVSKYLMGGRNMKSFPVAASLVACQISSITLLGIPADVYRYGAAYLWISLSFILVSLAVIFIFLPVFHKLQLTSIYEYFENRFDRKTRMLGSVLYVIRVASILPLTVYIPTLAMSNIFGIDFRITVVVVCSICILYTVIGGLKSVVWIDVFQLTIMFATFLVIFIMGTISVGGPSLVWNKAKMSKRLDIFDFDLDPTKRDSFWIIILGTFIDYLGENCNQSSIIKLTAIPKFRQCVIAVILYVLGMFFLKIGSTLNGLVIYAKYSDCDPFLSGQIKRRDALVPHFVMNLIEDIPGLPGLFVAGIFCASLSSFSTELNCLAAVIYSDFVLKYLSTTSSEKKTLNILKLIVVSSGVLMILLVFVVDRLGDVFQLVVSITAISEGAVLGIFTLGVMVPRAHSKGALYGGLLGMLCITCVLIPAKYYQSHQMFYYPTKPLSTEGCPRNGTITPKTHQTIYHSFANVTEKNSLHTFQPLFIFRISFYYYCVIGAIVTFTTGIIISYLTKKNDSPVDKALITPICHRLLPQESDLNGYRSVTTDAFPLS